MTFDTIRIPVSGAAAVLMRFSPLPRSGDFQPDTWHVQALKGAPGVAGEWWQVDLSALGIPDGAYEYDFRIERAGETFVVAPDPYAEEITRFGGYWGVFRMRNGRRYRLAFGWEGELPTGTRLPDNNEVVLYELPMRWVDSSSDAVDRQVGLGTFDKAIFERLAYLQRLGINMIELLPVQDSTDTLNWGYGTRFFFAPDVDMGEPVDLKLFIKECHRRGIRVILDVVMNHSKRCPLESLAYNMFYLKSGSDEPGPDGQPRNDWGGKLFRYRVPSDAAYHAREFHYGMAEFWIKEYHVDGFRIDEFKGIDSWDFIREFRNRAWQVQRTTFPGRPFIVIAEDSWRRSQITKDLGGGKVVDAMWDFDFRDEVRRLIANRISTRLGETSRSARVRALVTGRPQFDDLAARIAYNTSHDVEGREEQRLLQYFL